ncbi:MAG: hypothetical protein G01um101448_650 [Parcubacteria group bacterium Gr01-1014_48]|nr:MAG: hypothetical protein Greene041614_891 [Parcubacteria group bacterium Greene0416_14]TSC73660.1 MAG: hypothetical protein G01um101448_650 [Parcubacteria group bacterium Gr01-1014_48]TSD01104.1 MAG: hypothetical protein Greene101415_507 [Parcubacteria group bacterium Greene1014_15]TSD06892.1 MAG: hypothetical protein Greene07144_1089 [Parcubacteria group bacterium Greene0714_4]
MTYAFGAFLRYLRRLNTHRNNTYASCFRSSAPRTALKSVSPMNMTVREQKRKLQYSTGFTLVEMLVAIFVFTIVMVISMGAILSTLDANRKTQTVQLVIDNVDFALEGMARTLRTGMDYHCDLTKGTKTKPRDCKTGADSIVFEHAKGSFVDLNDNYAYKLDTGTKQIKRSIDSGVTFTPISAANVEITSLTFYVMNSDPTDEVQSRIIISVRGRAGAEIFRTKTEFNLQTMVTQRIPDIP